MKTKYDAFKTIPLAISDMAEKVGMPVTRVADVLPDVTKDILRTWHTKGTKPQLDQKIERAWKDIFGHSYTNESDLIKGSYLKGPPGQGKTTVFKAALTIIAKAMKVDLYLDPDIYDKPKQGDIVAVISQLGGAISASTLQGVPTTENGQTMYCPPSRINKMIGQDFRFLLLDDLDNANDGVKNAAMPIANDKQLNDVKLGDSCYVCVTGNLGEIDGTNTGRDSAALLNRTKVRLACDTLGDWLERGDERFKGVIGMAFVDEFLMENPEAFYPSVEKKYRGQRPTSRKWDDLVNDMRNVLAEYDQQQKEGMVPKPIMPQLSTMIPGHVGNRIGQELILYYSNALTLARPAAMELINKGELSEDMRDKLETTFTKEFTPHSESISRGFLRQVQRGVANEMKKYVTFRPVTPTEQKEASKSLFKSVDKLSKACFTTGLVKGNKLNLVANTVHNLMTDLIDYQIATGSQNETFGRKSSEGVYIPSKILTQLLTTAGNKYGADYPHGEALTNVGGSNTKTALETAVIDPLTYLDIIQDSQKELSMN